MLKKGHGLVFVCLSIFILVLLSDSIVLGMSDFSSNCSISACHNDPTGLNLIAESTFLEVSVNENFILNISLVSTLPSDTLVCKFPSDVADNALFTYWDLDNEGMVRDQDVADLDPDSNEILVQYSIFAPATPGSYVLHFFAATHVPSGDSIQVSVNVIDPFATSTTTTTSTTTSSQTTATPVIGPVEIILAILFSILYPNFLFTWVFLSVFLLAIMYLISRDKPKPRIIIPGTITVAFGWAGIIQSGYRVHPITLLIVIVGFAMVWYGELQARRIWDGQGRNR
ncbi:MAG: hypothetical protein ACFFEX_11020 [Candidatus Thorarchaeota archaeon]